MQLLWCLSLFFTESPGLELAHEHVGERGRFPVPGQPKLPQSTLSWDFISEGSALPWNNNKASISSSWGVRTELTALRCQEQMTTMTCAKTMEPA